ncbi:MAG: hypothetical protein ACRDQZ_15305, partial [Mycobacteriales bacterium]
GIYRGLGFGLVLHPQFPPDVYLEGTITRRSTLSREHQGPRAVLNALERLASAYGTECVRVQQDLAIAGAQLRDYQARLGKPFLHDAYLSDLATLRDQLKASLSSATHDADKETGPSVSDLAERIKALKAAQHIEATPQRAQQKQSTAEQPVTARIRLRPTAPAIRRGEAEATPVSNLTAETDAASGEAQQAESARDSSINLRTTFQERIAREQQRNDQNPNLS